MTDVRGTLSAIIRFSRLLADVREPQEILAGLGAEARSELGAPWTVAVALDPDGALRLVGEAPAGVRERLLAQPLEDLDWGLEEAEAYPLVCDGGLYGALLVGRPATAPDATLAAALADLAAVALHRAQLDRARLEALDELREARERLIRTEKLEALGRMATMVAHEVRNPLAGAAGALQVLVDRDSTTPDQRTVLRVVRDRLISLGEMVGDMLAYARPRALRPVRMDLLALAEATVEAVRSDPVSVGVRLQTRGEPVPVMADPDELRGLLLNLVLNACQVLGGRGTVVVEADHPPEGPRLRVADDGPGVPDALREVIFEPFQSLRAGGTGLGLAIARRVAEAHGGRLNLLCPAEGGAVFQLQLDPRRSRCP